MKFFIILISLLLVVSCKQKKIEKSKSPRFEKIEGILYMNKKPYTGERKTSKNKKEIYDLGKLKKEIEWKENGDRIEIEFNKGKAVKRSCWDKDEKTCPACRNHDIEGRKQGPMGNYTYKAGKVEGRYTRYHDNGKLKYETNYKNGKIDGQVTQWYDNGQKEYSTVIHNGLRIGETLTWYKDGKLKYRRFYKKGKLIKFIKYDKKGKIIKKK